MIYIPLPPVALASQHNGSWHHKSKDIALYRELGKHAALELKESPFTKRVSIRHEWYLGLTGIEKTFREQNKISKRKTTLPKKYRKYRPRDEQNAAYALKAPIDGFVDAGLLQGDTVKFLTWNGGCVFHSLEKQHQGRHGVVITLTEIE